MLLTDLPSEIISIICLFIPDISGYFGFKRSCRLCYETATYLWIKKCQQFFTLEVNTVNSLMCRSYYVTERLVLSEVCSSKIASLVNSQNMTEILASRDNTPILIREIKLNSDNTEFLCHGKYQRFHSNGRKKLEVHFISGLKEGIEREWNSVRKCIRTVKFQKGLMCGNEEIFRPEYNEYEINGWHQGRKHGVNIYIKNGRILTVSTTLKFSGYHDWETTNPRFIRMN